MDPETYDLFKAVVAADAVAVERAFARGADVNASDELGHNVLHYATLGSAINSFETAVQPRLSERRINVLQLVAEAPRLSLYSLNAPLPWAGGVTLLGLMSWLNMPSEIMCLLDFARGLLEVNAMDEHGATPLMYAARDGNIQVVRCLLAHGARPDLRDMNHRSAIQYALPYPEIVRLCEEALRRSRISEEAATAILPTRRRKYRPTTPFPGIQNDRTAEDLFFSDPDALLSPPLSSLDEVEPRRLFEVTLTAIHNGDIETLQKNLVKATCRSNFIQQRSQKPGSNGIPLLINFRDNTGLSLLHHAVSLGRSLNIAVVDALHNAGADMGLYSTLGFTPLHHLARTAKEDATCHDVPVYKRHLYAFTMHIIQDLRAPLAAADNKGETPLHAAAEYGRSISVLQAMLDCDKAFFGKESVRESRNGRGLRPVDVAKPEFLHVFVGEYQGIFDIPAVPDISPVTPGTGNSSERAFSLLRKSKSFLRVNTSTARPLGKKTSTTSLVSSSSSGSSSNQSNTFRQQKTFPNRKMATGAHSLPTPDPTPPGSFSGSFTGSLLNVTGMETTNVQSCTVDILYTLTFCGSALQAYREPQSKLRPLPDLNELLDDLIHCRLIVSHVLGYWNSRLDKLQEDFARTRVHIEKVNTLRKRIEKDIKAAFAQMDKPTKISRSLRIGSGGSDQLNVMLPVRQSSLLCGKQPRTDTASSGKTIQPEDFNKLDSSTFSGTIKSSIVETPPSPESDVDPSVHPDRTQLTPTPGRMMQKDTKPAPAPYRYAVKFPDTDPAEQERALRRKKEAMKQMQAGLQNAPKVLQRAEMDMQCLSDLFDHVKELLKRSDEAIQTAHDLVEEAITSREKQVDHLQRLHYGRSARLSPIEERSSEGHLSVQLEEVGSITIRFDNQHGLDQASVEEPHMLRRILTRGLEKNINRIAFDLQKTQVWLRVIREVLRGARRRVLTQQR